MQFIEELLFFYSLSPYFICSFFLNLSNEETEKKGGQTGELVAHSEIGNRNLEDTQSEERGGKNFYRL